MRSAIVPSLDLDHARLVEHNVHQLLGHWLSHRDPLIVWGDEPLKCAQTVFLFIQCFLCEQGECDECGRRAWELLRFDMLDPRNMTYELVRCADWYFRDPRVRIKYTL